MYVDPVTTIKTHLFHYNIDQVNYNIDPFNYNEGRVSYNKRPG